MDVTNPVADDFEKLEEVNLPIAELIQQKVNKSVRDLYAFFRENNFVTEKNNQTTNIINVALKKTYNIPNTHIDTFFGLLDAARKESAGLHFSERQETEFLTHSGIMIDFDRFQSSRDEQFTVEHHTEMVVRIGELLGEMLDFTPHMIDKQFNFHMFFIKKPTTMLMPAKPGDAPGAAVYKDGFHILIPEIQVTRGFKRYLLDEMIRQEILTDVYSNIPHLEPAEKMLDLGSARNPVHFFGNSKVDRPSYYLSHAYTCKMTQRGASTVRFDKNTINVADVLARGDINLTYELSLGFNTLRNSSWLNKRQIMYKPELETKIKILVEKSSNDIISDTDLEKIDDSVNILTLCDAEARYIKELLEILDISYATDYKKWFGVLCAIAHTSKKYKSLAIAFSQRRPEAWSSSEVDRVWAEACAGKAGGRPLTKRSIIYWAKLSSPEKYHAINTTYYVNQLQNYIYSNDGRVEHAMVAKILYLMTCNKFAVDTEVCDNDALKSYQWYEFVIENQSMKKGEIYKWRREGNPDTLHTFMVDTMPSVYKQALVIIKEHREAATTEPLIKYWATLEKEFKRSTTRLYDNNFQNHVIKQAQYRYRIRGFIEAIDKYENIIGVGNGILKLGIKSRLITGYHEYRITKYTTVDYEPFDINNQYVKTLMQSFRDVFPELDVFEFMLFHASTGLDTKEAIGLLLLLVGGGQNGKSYFLKMIHNTLGGKYCGSGKISLLTSPNERAESANSAQMQMRGKSYFYFEEANKCEILNESRLKTIVSPGYQSGRDLHEKQSNFSNTANPVAASNYDFIITSTDHGTWRRVYYYCNKVKFCSDPDPENPLEKLEDRRFIHQLPNDPNYLKAMLSIMVHYYERLQKEYDGDLKNVPVPTIAHETHIFRERQDSMHKFINQMIVISPGHDPISLQTVAEKYIEWYTRMITKVVQTNTIEVMAQLQNSCLATHLKRLEAKLQFLTGHRVKNSAEESLEDGESYMIGDYINRAVIPTARVAMPSLPERERTDHFVPLQGPRHAIQNTDLPADNIAPLAIDIAALMDELSVPAPAPAKVHGGARAPSEKYIVIG